jgi:amino-acid N-acetyltransferase
MNRKFEQATTANWPQIVALLRSIELPLDGLYEHLGTMLVAKIGNEIVGCAALELYGHFALLRSVAVAKSHQGHGLGLALTASILDLSRALEVQRIYLLTETAGEFFSRYGFKPIDRLDVPEVVKQSVEFVSACPVSCLAMVLTLETDPASL